MLTGKENQKCIKIVRTCIGPDADSDHFMLSIKRTQLLNTKKQEQEKRNK